MEEKADHLFKKTGAKIVQVDIFFAILSSQPVPAIPITSLTLQKKHAIKP